MITGDISKVPDHYRKESDISINVWPSWYYISWRKDHTSDPAMDKQLVRTSKIAAS